MIDQTKFDQTNFIINGEVNKLISMHKCPDSFQPLSLHSCMSMHGVCYYYDIIIVFTNEGKKSKVAAYSYSHKLYMHN